jgi:hypothetical protein
MHAMLCREIPQLHWIELLRLMPAVPCRQVLVGLRGDLYSRLSGLPCGYFLQHAGPDIDWGLPELPAGHLCKRCWAVYVSELPHWQVLVDNRSDCAKRVHQLSLGQVFHERGCHLSQQLSELPRGQVL